MRTLYEVEQDYIMSVLKLKDGCVAHAAKVLGISRHNIYDRLGRSAIYSLRPESREKPVRPAYLLSNGRMRAEKKRIPNHVKKRVRELLRDGLKHVEIAELLGIKATTVSHIAKCNNG